MRYLQPFFTMTLKIIFVTDGEGSDGHQREPDALTRETSSGFGIYHFLYATNS